MAELLLKAHIYKYYFLIHKVFGIIITIVLHTQAVASFSGLHSQFIKMDQLYTKILEHLS